MEPERHLRAANQDWSLDEVGLLHHQVDRFRLGLRQCARFEYGAARADELEEPVGIDMLLEKGSIRRVPVDVTFFDVDLLLLQKTSGVSARRSRGLEVEDWLGHGRIVRLGRGTIESTLDVDDQRDFSLDSRGVDPYRSAMRVRPPDGL
jgi:hypothetical protein